MTGFNLKERFLTMADFGWALNHLRQGNPVFRSGWNGKDMAIELASRGNPDDTFLTHDYLFIEYPEGHPAYPNGLRVPWLASQTDMLADDWEMV